MIRGRHRILPAAIDRAVLVPGEELMEKLDNEYGRGNLDRDTWEEQERQVRNEESGRRAEQEPGEDEGEDGRQSGSSKQLVDHDDRDGARQRK